MSVLIFLFLSLSLGPEVFARHFNHPVGTKENPGLSCWDIKTLGGTVSKNYYIQLAGRTVLVHCDQTTAGGGWTLVYSYTFTDFFHFDHGSNAVTPRPNWPDDGNVRVSTITPGSETDYNAMDFNLWGSIGSEFMIKSNINNWIACKEGTGSLVNWISGTLKCKLVKNVTGKCANIVPNAFQNRAVPFNNGPVFYDSSRVTPNMKSYYYFESFTTGTAFPTHDPCGADAIRPVLSPPNPHGNVYIR